MTMTSRAIGESFVENTLEVEPHLKFAKLAPKVWEALGNVKRIGWKERGVTNPESDLEHTIALRNIAASVYGELSEEERDDLLDILEVHEWPEAIEGDTVIIYANDE